VRDAGGSILRHGDLSVLSFHATKVFQTFEGGAIICPDAKTKQRINHLKNFGFVDEVTVVAPGINGKMSEVNAAFGLLQLKHIDNALARRRQIGSMYDKLLADVPGIRCIGQTGQKVANYSYYPILVGPEYRMSRDALYERMQEHGIRCRRYFYPLISDFPMYRGLSSAAPGNLQNAAQIASKVMCLPMYPDLPDAAVEAVCALIVDS
jgi:dTDP-4-amino-4,6-dideoxygalactose transaminase